MKYTLLDLVQTIASSMDSDEVNSVNDSVESLQIANVIRTVYFDIITRANLPSQYSIINLEASGDATKPTLMYIPDEVANIEWVKYNKRIISSDPLTMETVDFMTLNDFFTRMSNLNPNTDTHVGSFPITIGSDTFTIQYRNDQPPSYYTTFNDNTLVFDCYNADLETTLQGSNTACYAKLNIPWTLSDNFIPDLNEEQFPLLLNEAKSLAWAELKQTTHTLAERNSRRAWVHTEHKKHQSETVSSFDELPYYGRK